MRKHSKIISTQFYSNLQNLKQFDLYSFLRYQIPSLYRKEDAILHGVVLIALIGSLLIHFFNYLGPQYDTSQFGVGSDNLSSIPGMIILGLLGYSLSNTFPRISLFLVTFAQIWIFYLLSLLIASSLLATPFPIIDQSLLKFDQILGFDILQLMDWLSQHVALKNILMTCYNSWLPQIVFAPLILAIFKQRNEIDGYLLATFISFIIASIIYYFFPTIAPAGILKNPHFLQSQLDLVTRFDQIHHYLKVTVFDGGLIAFPSCHVINALLVTYFLRKIKFLFYPLLIINTLLIFSTLALGFHYLADVLGSLVIVFFVLVFVERTLFRRSN